jgi:hypothetical protein
MFGAAAIYLKIVLFAAGLACVQTAVGGAAYGKNATAARKPRHMAMASAVSAPALCRAAVQAASDRWGIPRGLLLAIAQVETGRAIGSNGTAEPWPWSANAESHALFFATRADAVAWTTRALARGVASIDSGCLQVNLEQHPQAFASVDEAFNPAKNADYAARFLLGLYRQTGNWITAAGWYHSHTPLLAGPYREAVQAKFAATVAPRGPSILEQMAAAWAATRGNPTRPPQAAGLNDAALHAIRVNEEPLAERTCSEDDTRRPRYDAWGMEALRLDHPCAPP